MRRDCGGCGLRQYGICDCEVRFAEMRAEWEALGLDPADDDPGEPDVDDEPDERLAWGGLDIPS